MAHSDVARLCSSYKREQVSGQLPEDREGSPKAHLTATSCSIILHGAYTQNVCLQIVLSGSSTRSRMSPVRKTVRAPSQARLGAGYKHFLLQLAIPAQCRQIENSISQKRHIESYPGQEKPMGP